MQNIISSNIHFFSGEHRDPSGRTVFERMPVLQVINCKHAYLLLIKPVGQHLFVEQMIILFSLFTS